MQQTATVRAIIKKGRKILLLRRIGGTPAYSGLYELPGGKLSAGEEPKVAIMREVHEEVGVEPSVAQLRDIVTYQNPKNPGVQHNITVFTAGIDFDANIRLSGEHDKFIWAKLSDIQHRNLTETTRAALVNELPAVPTEESETPIASHDEYTTTSIRATPDVFVYSDGGSRGNPGPSAAGFVILDDQQSLLWQGGTYLGITTSNQAEYQAVRLALQKALQLGARRVRFSLDSLLVTDQMNGIYQIKNRDLWPIHAAIKELISKFQKVTFTHVNREYNTRADAMVNKVLDAHARAE